MPRLLDMPLQRKIGLLVVAGLLALFCLFGLLGMVLANEGTQQMEADRLVMARLTASYLDDEFGEQFAQLEQAAALLARADGDSGAQRSLLRNLLRQPEPFVSTVFLTGRSGDLLWSEPPDLAALSTELASHPHVLDPVSTGKRYASGIQAVGPQGRPSVIMTVPVRGLDGTVAGVIGAVVDPNGPALDHLVDAARELGKTGHAELIDQNGRVIAASEPGRQLGLGEHPDFYKPLLQKRISAVGVTPPIGDEDPAERGTRHVMAFVPLFSVPWSLSLGNSESEFNAFADNWRTQTLLIGGFSLLVALFLVWITTRGVARPVQALTAASRRIAGGDLATPVPTLGEGEVRSLAEAFDDMRIHLRQALEALAVEKSRYQGIVGSMADAVFTTDSELRITAFNPAAEALMGWGAEDALGRTCCDVMMTAGEYEPDGCPERCPFQPLPQTLGPSLSKETIRRRDGRPVVVATARSAILDRDGALVGVVHVLRDVSAEEELSRLKDEFLSTVSHELRTPLGYIKGYSSTLLLPDDPLDEETTRKCLRRVVEASDELQELVDNLLDMSKIDPGVLSVEPRPVRLGGLARSAVERVRIRAAGHRLRVAIPSALPLVSADPRRLEQVLYNLLDNAIKYSPEGGRIAVEAHVAGAEVMVSVSDEGLGVPPEELDRLFERFHRGRTARAHHIGGTGLGLAICKGIVETHGGRIWAESPAFGRQPGVSQGTVIHFTLPTVAAAGRRLPGRRSEGSRERPIAEGVTSS